MSEWKKVKLGDAANISSSKRIFANEYRTSGIPFYRGKEVVEKHNCQNVSTELFISKERYLEIKEKYGVPQKGDILLTSVGTLGVTWFVDDSKFYFKDGNLTRRTLVPSATPNFFIRLLYEEKLPTSIRI